MIELLQKLRHKVAIGFVGGSDLAKQQEQLGSTGSSGNTYIKTELTPVIDMFDYCFPENGLTAYRQGTRLPAQVTNCFVLAISRLSLNIWARKSTRNLSISVYTILRIWKFPSNGTSSPGPVDIRGTFVEFRTGMINVSPVGRNASSEERDAYEKYDIEHKIREKFIEEIHKKFPDIGLTYSIGIYLLWRTNDRRTNFIWLFSNRMG
jgi:phosphomannomutase